MQDGAGWGGSKKCKPIPAPSHGAGLKSCPIPAPPPLRGGENPHGAKRGGAGQAGRGKIAIPTKRQEHISKGLLRGTKRIYKLDAISVLKFQNHLDIFVPAHQLSPI